MKITRFDRPKFSSSKVTLKISFEARPDSPLEGEKFNEFLTQVQKIPGLNLWRSSNYRERSGTVTYTGHISKETVVNFKKWIMEIIEKVSEIKADPSEAEIIKLFADEFNLIVGREF